MPEKISSRFQGSFLLGQCGRASSNTTVSTRESISMPHCATGFSTWWDPAACINVAMDWTDFDAAWMREDARLGFAWEAPEEGVPLCRATGNRATRVSASGRR
jgi:hypothetical protein